ncbi:MAG TPA: DUF4012 domain-containing protein [Acidimicrobiales bacterium]|nr:DUF4012 domain-containing protein [Acidimicrobiales bacterium]
MAALRHRGQRRYHQFRHGLGHFLDHQRGVDHKHRRRSSSSVPADGSPRQKARPRDGATRAARRRRWAWLWIGLGIVVVILVAVGLLAWNAYRSLERAKSSLEEARSAVSGITDNPNTLLSADGRAGAVKTLRQVAADAAAARANLTGSAGLSTLGRLPFADTQRDGALTLVDDLETTARTGTALITRVNDLVSASSGTTVALPQLKALQQEVARAAHTLAPLAKPVGGLISPLASAQATFDREDAKVVRLLHQGTAVLSYALPFLGADGPRTYLLAGENNAEMRDQGAVLSVAELTATDGTFSMATAESIGTLPLKTPAPVAVPAGTQQIFGPLQPTRVWQSTNATATFPWSGLDMQAMYGQAAVRHVDGVIGVDVPALASLLKLTGPVTVPGIGKPISATNVTPVLLNQLYQGYPAGPQTVRHDDISAVARAAVDKMKTEHVDLAALAKALATDVAGRHLLVWDETPSYERTLVHAGASGAVDTTDPTRTFHVAVESATAAKLDYFVHVNLRMDVTLQDQGTAVVYTYVTIINDAPAGQKSSYQLGPDGVNTSVPGQYAARVLLWSPRGSQAAGGVDESGLVVNETAASVLPQQRQTVLFKTTIPHAVRNGRLDLHLVPQPTLSPASLTVNIAAGPDWTLGGPRRVTRAVNKAFTLSWTATRH